MILEILYKLKKYKYVLITDTSDRMGDKPEKNEEILAGAGTRKTGLHLKLSPFCERFETVNELNPMGYTVRTVLMRSH